MDPVLCQTLSSCSCVDDLPPFLIHSSSFFSSFSSTLPRLLLLLLLPPLLLAGTLTVSGEVMPRTAWTHGPLVAIMIMIMSIMDSSEATKTHDAPGVGANLPG